MGKNINWDATIELKLAKMLAYGIFEAGTRNENQLWERFVELLPEVSTKVLGKNGFTMECLIHQVRTEQGLEITRNKLLQRADKAGRYNEFNPMKEAVLAAMRSDPPPNEFNRDSKRDFDNETFLASLKIHGGACVYCHKPFTGPNKPVADHYIPWSKGGRTELSNCVPACTDCNSQKSNRYPHEFMLALVARNEKMGRKI